MQMFDLGDDRAVCCNPGGRFHGWLFRRHPDGQYVSVRQLGTIENPAGDLLGIFEPPELRK